VKRVTWPELRNSGVGIIDEATATQRVVVLVRRETELAVIVPVARYTAMMRRLREVEK
jgi:prevent-host-death family protein